MRSWTRVGGFLAVALVLLGPVATMACTRLMPESWTVESQDSRFEIILETRHVGSMSLPRLTLRDRRSGRFVWQTGIEHGLLRQDVLLSPDGRYLAMVDSLWSHVVILGPDGSTSGHWSLETHLTPQERRKLQMTLCGSWWTSSPAFDGQVLTLVVPMDLPSGHPEPPYPGPVPGIRFRIDPLTGQVSRDRPLPEKSPEPLLQAFRTTDKDDYRKDDYRRELARELAGLSQRSPRGSHPELRRFWLELVRDPKTDGWVLQEALEGLHAIGTDEEIRGLFTLLLQQADTASADALVGALVLLDRRLPEEAVRQSLRVLTELPPSIPSDLLRSRAVFTVGQRPGAEIDKALQRALRDPVAAVRAGALFQLSQRMTPLQGIELALRFLEDSDNGVRDRAAEVLCELLRRARGPEWRAAIDLLRRTEAGGKLAPFPEGLVLLAAVADKEGERERAVSLYARGLEAMADIPEQRGWKTYSVRLEAKLQLALEARARGRLDEARRLAREVIKDRSSNIEVCAPAPNVLLPFGRPEACAAQQTAAQVAVELLEPSRPGSRP